MYVARPNNPIGLGDGPSFSVSFYDPFQGTEYPHSAVPTSAGWRIKIDGATPGAPVALTTNGQAQSLGSIDADGKLDWVTSLVGVPLGLWNTVVTVGGVQLGSYSVTLIAPIPGVPTLSKPSGVLAGPA